MDKINIIAIIILFIVSILHIWGIFPLSNVTLLMKQVGMGILLIEELISKFKKGENNGNTNV